MEEKGFTLAEVLVGIALLIIVFTGLYGAFQFGLRVVGNSKAKNLALFLANQTLEEIRTLPYEDVGTVGGIPPGVIPQVQEKVSNGIKFVIKTTILYEDDPFDGIAPEDTLPTDYKKVKVEVSWSSFFGGEVNLQTIIAPQGVETTEGGGTLKIYVLNAFGEGVPQADIHIVNDKVSPPIDAHYQSDDYGTLVIAGAPSSTESYQVTVTKPGFSTDRTYGRDEIANPLKPHLSVFEGEVTQASFSIDKTSNFSVETRSRESFDDDFGNWSKISESDNVTLQDGRVQLRGIPGGNSQWQWRRKIIFDNSSQNEDLLDVPVLIVLNSSNFDFSQAASDGSDIRFYDSDAVTALAYEIESWDSQNQKAYIWVKVPKIESASSTDYIWMYWGNPNARDNQNPQAVWTENYVGVYHLNETTTPTVKDSTQNNLEGKIIGSPQRGVSQFIAGSYQFDVSDAVSLKQYVSRAPTTAGTWSFWINRDWDDSDTTDYHVGGFVNTSQWERRVNFWWRGASNREFWAERENTTRLRVPADKIPQNQWKFVVLTWQDSQRFKIYVDGILQDESYAEPFSGAVTDWCFGGDYYCDNPWYGDWGMRGELDEVRWSSVPRSPDWIRFQYCVMKQNCVSYGPPESLVGGGELSGFVTSIAIAPQNLINWDRVIFNDEKPEGTSILYQVLYATSSQWVPLPDQDLPGNSTGFTTSPIDISSLDVNKYSSLKIKAILESNNPSLTPYLDDWHLTYNTVLVGNIPFHLEGSKIIGTDSNDQPVLKYSQDHQTDPTGHIEISNLEWDSYTFSATGTTGMDLVETVPSPQPIDLLPGTTTPVALYFKPANSLLVKVLDATTSEPIFAASVRVFNQELGYDRTQPTNEQGNSYFVPLERGQYSIEVDHPDYQSTTTFAQVLQDTVATIYLLK